MIDVVGLCLIIYADKLFYCHHTQQSMTLSKRSMGRQTESPPSQKKRKQLSMDDYLTTVSFNPHLIPFYFPLFFVRGAAEWMERLAVADLCICVFFFSFVCREKGRSNPEYIL
jgi:hypothetical protein